MVCGGGGAEAGCNVSQILHEKQVLLCDIFFSSTAELLRVNTEDAVFHFLLG